jgi:hypothetical protein
MKLIKINGEVPWRVAQAEGGQWVGVCDPLKLTIQAPSWADLMEDIGETLNVVFHDLLKSNELERFLRDRGWTPVEPLPEDDDSIAFDIPFLPSLARDREIGLSE